MSIIARGKFEGFKEGKFGNVPVPNPFFSELLPFIDDVAELKLTIYLFWAIQQREGEYRYMRLRDLLEDATFMSGLDPDPAGAAFSLQRALDLAVARGTLLHVDIPSAHGVDPIYFMNSARGRSAVAAIVRGDWAPGTHDLPVALIEVRPNIYTLYEQNISALTPMLAAKLADDEQTYPAEWIIEAMQIAVEANKRNLSYIEAILRRWQAEGKSGFKDKSAAERDAEVNPYLQDVYFQRGTDHTEE